MAAPAWPPTGVAVAGLIRPGAFPILAGGMKRLSGAMATPGMACPQDGRAASPVAPVAVLSAPPSPIVEQPASSSAALTMAIAEADRFRTGDGAGKLIGPLAFTQNSMVGRYPR